MATTPPAMQGDTTSKGLLRAPDPGDLKHLMASHIPELPLSDPTLPDLRYYRTGPTLNQGRTSKCVAFSVRQWKNSAPFMDTKPYAAPTTDEIYAFAQANDEWPGAEPSYYGTSIRAGAKAAQRYGWLREYVWSKTADEVGLFLLSKGTVIFGTNWYPSMYYPTKEGIVDIGPTERPDGGHAYLCIGYNRRRAMFRFINSWGGLWGQNGRFWMSHETVERLLLEDGEACAGLEVRL